MKLPIIAITLKAYGYVWRERRRFLALALPAIIIQSLVLASMVLPQRTVFGTAITENDSSSATIFELLSSAPIWYYAAELVAFSIGTAVFIMFSVAWHRSFLLPEENLSVRAVYSFHQRLVQFFLNYLKVYVSLILIFFAATQIMSLAARQIFFMANTTGGISAVFVSAMFAVPVFAALALVYARVSMVFPAAAIDSPLTMRKAWRITQGQGWRLILVVLFAALPILLLFWLPVTSPAELLNFIALQDSMTATLLVDLFYQFVSYICLAVGITALSIAYTWLLGFGATVEA